MSEPYSEVARVAGVLEDSLQGEVFSLARATVSTVLHSRGEGAVH